MNRLIKKLPPLAMQAAMIVLVACSVGDPTSPTPRLSAGLQQQLLPNGEVSQVALDLTPADTQFATLALRKNISAWYAFGPHKLYVPGYVICDPGTSGYGLSYWLQPCKVLKGVGKVNVTVKYWTDSRGYARAEFGPNLRFHPTTGYVELHLMDALGSRATSSAILHCIDGTEICVNESATDPLVVTHRDPATGWVWRIIRHFSGYNVWA